MKLLTIQIIHKKKKINIFIPTDVNVYTNELNFSCNKCYGDDNWGINVSPNIGRKALLQTMQTALFILHALIQFMMHLMLCSRYIAKLYMQLSREY